MSALDAARGRYYDKDIAEFEAAPRESPARPTMGAGEHLGPQFSSVVPNRELDLGYDAEADNQSFMNDLAQRHPYRINGQAVHQYMTSPGSARNG